MNERDQFFDSNDYIRIVLKDVVVEAHIGLHPWERHPERPSRLRISVDLFAHLQDGPLAADTFIDYDGIRDFLLTLKDRPHTDLIETLMNDIVAKCFENDRVEACRVSILKPDIFNEADAAGIEVFRTRSGWKK